MKSSQIRFALKVAHAAADESRARRLQVGAVIVVDGRIIRDGWNGMPAGMDNNCEYNKVVGYKMVINQPLGNNPIFALKTKPEVTHAEMNAIGYAARSTGGCDGASLVVTHSPCYECAKLIIAAGIKEVYYEELYRDERPLEFLESANIKVERITNET